MRLLPRSLLLIAALAAPVPVAHATTYDVCGNGTAAGVCSRFVFTNVLNGSFTVRVLNTSTVASATISSFAIWLPGTFTDQGINPAVTNWVYGTAEGFDASGFDFAAKAAPPPAQNGIDKGVFREFTFVYGTPSGAINLDGVGFGLRVIELPNAINTGSYKCGVAGGSGLEACSTSVVPNTTVPEPETYGLLAAGLVGLALAGRRRRAR